MTIEIEVLCEAFASLKQYIPAKDRQDAADSVMSAMIDMLGDEDLAAFGDSDATLRRAYKEYVGDDNEVMDDLYE